MVGDNQSFLFSRDPKERGTQHCRLSKTCVWGCFGITLIGLLFVAVWFRCRLLGNLPGLNGDEAWYGVQAANLLQGVPASWQTPTGNPLNPLFIGPLVLLHLWFWPSIVLLRSVAVVSGLTALVLNWVLCRWVYDRRMAWISTTALAVLPINIAYSRFAWDASQSLAATLPVVYFALAAIRFPQWKGRLIAAAAACQLLAVLVHPTNIFVATAIAAVLAAQGKPGDRGSLIHWLWKHPLAVAATLTLCVLMGIWIIWLFNTPLPQWLDARPRESIGSNNVQSMTILYPRLFTGGTIYRYIAGSSSWFQWPLSAECEGFGVDALVFWLLIVAAGTILWRSWKSAGREEDGVLIAAWTSALAAFLLLAGPRAMSPGQERFAICLIAPTMILICRALALALTWGSTTSRIVLLVSGVVGWLILADFHVHYFRFIEKTGGQAHRTFRTGDEEPKVAAWKYILQRRGAGETWIVTSEWWNYWPLKYLSTAKSDLHVVTPQEAAREAGTFTAAIDEARVWRVEFSQSKILKNIEAKLAKRDANRHEIKDYGGRPILTVVCPDGMGTGD